MDDVNGTFIEAFLKGDVEKAIGAFRTGRQARLGPEKLPSPLKESILANKGQCHRGVHLRIAHSLMPPALLAFQESVLTEDRGQVESFLKRFSGWANAEFVAGFGISRPLHHFRTLGMAELLLEHGARLNELTSRGETPLAIQLRLGSIEEVRFLLDQGADPNRGRCAHLPSKDMSDRIALLKTYGWKGDREQLVHDARRGHAQRVRTWVKAGADVHAQDEQGRTALHWLAARGTGSSAIDTLIMAGADALRKDNDGQTPLQLAREAPQGAALKALSKWRIQ